jgi:ABC-type nitrate/sulfonate/bicarbonate transport system ATPase subunit
MSHIKIEHLRKEYINRRQKGRNTGVDSECDNCGHHVVLDGINLEFEEGELVCILGSSGCGKSTLLRIIAGFDHASSGRVLANDQVVNSPSEHNIFVFQHSGLLPWKTAWQNIELGLRHMEDAHEKNELVQEYIDMVELTGFEHHYPHQMSGGMQRRAELARALAVNPETLIMDEPFTGLDFMTHMKMREEVVNMHALLGKSMIMVTHFIDDALVMGDRIVILGGTPSQVKLERKLDIPHPRNIEKNAELNELRDELYLMMGVSYVA